jgi:hypothetical protein
VPYLLIEDFRSGIDLRKSPVAAEPGTLRVLKNGFITPGGEVEKRLAATSIGVLPAGTHGLGFESTANFTGLVVFGTVNNPGPMPPYVRYQKLTLASGTPYLVRVWAVEIFATKLYVIGEFSDGTIRHFYDGVQVPVSEVTGRAARPFNRKMYAVDGTDLLFSALFDPTSWTTGTGSGVIDVSAEDVASTDLVGLERYYSFLAVFARTYTQIWAMDPDPDQSALIQTLHNIGLVAPGASAAYGNGDVLFLSDTGIRSLRARDSSNAAVLADVGSPIDVLIRGRRADLTDADIHKIKALVDPLTGHYWLVWGRDVFVLASSPGGKTMAWSTFDFGSTVDHTVVANSRIAFRMGNGLFVYGSMPASGGNPFLPNTPVGMTAARYDAASVEAVTPFMDARNPAQTKFWTSLDMTCQGTWRVFVNPDPNQPGAWTQVGTITRDTWGEGRLPIDMHGTHMAVRAVSVGQGAATLSTMGLHYQGGEES